jgi:hypothetical membrane protein
MKPLQKDNLTKAALGSGIAVPFFYYGIQGIAAPFFPGFSFLSTTASELGSDRSTHPEIFNTGVILVGVATLLASVGFLRALRHLGTSPILAWFVFVTIAVTGLTSLWAGIFPLPDPRHGGHPSLLVVMILLPFVLAVSLWTLGVSWPVKAYLAATVGLLLVMVPVMSGMTGLDTHAYRGLFQRIFALTIFLPIGVGSYILASTISWFRPRAEV